MAKAKAKAADPKVEKDNKLAAPVAKDVAVIAADVVAEDSAIVAVVKKAAKAKLRAPFVLKAKDRVRDKTINRTKTFRLASLIMSRTPAMFRRIARDSRLKQASAETVAIPPVAIVARPWIAKHSAPSAAKIVACRLARAVARCALRSTFKIC